MFTVNRPEDNSDFDDDLDINDLPVDLPPCPPLHAATSAIVVDEQPDPTPLDVPLVTGTVCYYVLKNGSEKKKDVVVSSDGHTFTKSKFNKRRFYWQCAHRGGQRRRCGATVRSTDFSKGSLPHCHPPNFSDELRRRIVALCKAKEKENIYTSAVQVSEEIITSVSPSMQNNPSVPVPKNIAKAVDRDRKHLNDDDPKDLN